MHLKQYIKARTIQEKKFRKSKKYKKKKEYKNININHKTQQNIWKN